MDNVKRLTQAYSQAYSLSPWRKQLQVIVFFLLVLVFTATVAVVYLNVSARAVALGHEIQDLQAEMDVSRRLIADQETQLARLTSSEIMEERARDLGFEPVNPEDIVYIIVPGYSGREAARLAPPPGPTILYTRQISPDYTKSLVDWISENLLSPDGLLAEVKP